LVGTWLLGDELVADANPAPCEQFTSPAQPFEI